MGKKLSDIITSYTIILSNNIIVRDSSNYIIVRTDDDGYDYGISLLNNNPSLTDIYLSVITTEDISYEIRYYVHNTLQIDLIIADIFLSSSYNNDKIYNKKNINNILNNKSNIIDNDIYISDINLLDISNIENTISHNNLLPKYIDPSKIKTVNLMNIFKIVSKIEENILHPSGILKYLLKTNPEKAISYIDQNLKSKSNLEIIPTFIKNTINIIEYYPYIEEYGIKYLELNKDNIELNRDDIKYVNYSLAHVIMSKLGKLPEDEKELTLEYLFNSCDIEDSKKLRTRLFFDYIGLPMNINTPFYINNDFKTFMNLGKMIKDKR